MPARSVYVQFDVQSLPDTKLVLTGSGLDHGIWSNGLQPPATITPPVNSVHWQSESDGFLTGTQGWVRYYPVTPGGSVPANPPDADTIWITWDDPYVGQNSYNSSAPVPYAITGGSTADYVADNDTAVFTLTLNPATQYSSTTPALTYFAPAPLGGQLVLAYVANSAGVQLLSSTTDTPGTWSNINPVSGQQSSIAPAIAQFGNQLALAYVAANGSGELLVSLSKDGVNWSSSHSVGGQNTAISPALVSMQDKLYMVYVANTNTNDLLLTTSSDGINWNKATHIKGQQSSLAPALTWSGNPLTPNSNSLYLTYVANNGSNEIFWSKSSDEGATWTNGVAVKAGQASPLAPAITNFGGKLVMAYIADNGSNDIFTTISTDGGSTWSPGAAVTGQLSPNTPAIAALNETLVMVYVCDNVSNRLIVATSTNGTTWTEGVNLAGA